MISSEDEQDDNSIFDQLKSIKPFPVDQLYLLHPDVGCPPTSQSQTTTTNGDIDNIYPSSSSDTYHDEELYQNLIEYEQLRIKLAELRNQVKMLYTKTFDHVDRVWTIKDQSSRKIGMCQQGKIAETTFKYKQAILNPDQLDVFNVSFTELADLINKEYIYYSFESQMKRHKIATQLSNSYQIENIQEREAKLRPAIATLLDFIKHLGDSKSDFVLQCRRWLRGLIKRFLQHDATVNFRFIISQLSKGPSGTAEWSADLIECKSYDKINSFEAEPQYISHCSALLGELFFSFRTKLRSVSSDQLEVTNKSPSTDQNWSLIDPRFNCSEELNIASSNENILSECDMIKLCLKIPVAQIFRAYVKKCLTSDELLLETDKNYQYIMLKLLTIGTIIIKTYQVGLETFNSIQYGNLIEYLSSQIRRTVIVLSDQWAEFKRRLKGVDDALLMRLQVEYDNFILRSILIILELRQSGIWRHLSQVEPDNSRDYDNSNNWSTESLRPAFFKLLQVTGLSPTVSTPSQAIDVGQTSDPKQSRARSSTSLTYEFSTEWFKEVSEPMLWHILWQFYHNAFTSSCDYHSDNYWVQKFREKSVVYLFVNKIRDSPPGECSYLLNSITSMVLSRTRNDSKLVTFIANEIFDLSFKHASTKAKVAKEGLRSLIRCAEKFPNLISAYISYIAEEDMDDENIVELFKGCSLCGWLFNEEEFNLIACWLLEQRLTSVHNKVARLIISKILINNPEVDRSEQRISRDESIQRFSPHRRRKSNRNCYVDLKLRRRIALLLYKTCTQHAPEAGDLSVQSLGASVEVAFGSLYCERTATTQNNLIELSTDTNYNQLYVWSWRLLFTLRLHILNQPETDWNDVQSRSGTSRSIKNTVLFDDSFHPVPSTQDSECLPLSDGISNENPMASFVYLLMTDVTWQTDTLDDCLKHLNVMAKSGHLTPSLMTMKYLTICHLNDLCETVAKDQKCLDYFMAIILSNFDSVNLASLIMSQLDRLKQYRQLQLSQFYIRVLIEVATSIDKQVSSSWFSGNEHCLEKVACLLDYIVKFNFTTQRNEIIRKFYDCSYSIQASAATGSWFGSLFTSSTLNAVSTRREFLTTLHVLTQKYKKYSWLRWVTTECDTIRLEKIWEKLVVFLSYNESSNIDAAIKDVCPQVNVSILKSILPIHSWIKQIFDIMETDLSHPLCPLIWYNFFLNYFANSLNGVSVGLNLVPAETQTKLMTRLDSLFNYHLYKHKNWTSSSLQQNSLAQLYRAYKLWLQDPSLRDAYVDIDRLKEDYLVPLLKAVMESSTEGACIQYIDIQGIETQSKNLIQLWSTATRLEGNNTLRDMIFVESNHDESMDILTSVDDEASDAVSLIVRTHISQPEQNKLLANAEEELKNPVKQPVFDGYQTFDEVIQLVKDNFHSIFDESSMFNANLGELIKTKLEIEDLARKLYTHKKRELLRVVPCIEGHECAGPARIKLEVEEATIDERKSQCIQDRRRQCEEIVLELLSMPTNRVIQSTVVIEENVKQLVGDQGRSKQVIEALLRWIGEPTAYKQLNGSYYPANHLLKTMLELLSASEHTDTYNSILIDVCFSHPKSVQIFSPFLSPSACSPECFLDLYKKMSEKHSTLGPTAMFVMLSKFDVNLWLNNIKQKQMHHDLIKATCYALSGMGKDPDESFISTFELYKRHIHLELDASDRRRPDEIALVMGQFLQYMDEQTLAPSLWLDLMGILGLEKTISTTSDNSDRGSTKLTRSPASTISSIAASDSYRIPIQLGLDSYQSTVTGLINDISRLADCQMILDYHALDRLMKMLSEFVSSKRDALDITILEFYFDYLDEFSLVMMSITFMWLKSISDQYPDNHKLIWKQLLEVWYDWVFFSKNCQNVGKTSYDLMANSFVLTLSYMIQKIPDNTQQVLHCTLMTLTEYVSQTKEVVYLELTILQRSLRKLPWSRLLATAEDFKNLASLSEQENYNMSDLVSHIMMQIDVKSSLAGIHETRPEVLPEVAERLAKIIIIQSTQLKGFRLLSGYFTMVPVDQVSKLAALILTKMEFANLEHSQINKLLVNLLRLMCIRLDLGDSQAQSEMQIADSLDRSIVYGQFVSNYLIDLMKNHPTVLQHHEAYLCAVLDNSLQDLKILLSPDVDLSRKTQIYGSLLECCSSEELNDYARFFLAKAFTNSKLLTSRPVVVLEVFHAIGKILRDGQILAHAIEKMISIYFNMGGHYEKVLKSFSLKVLPSDLYLEACIEESTPLALLVYFESLYRNGQSESQQMSDSSTLFNISSTKIWSSFFHWIAQLTVKTQTTGLTDNWMANDVKLAVAWLKLIAMLETDLQQFLLNDRIVGNESGLNKTSNADSKSETGSLSSQPSTDPNSSSSTGSPNLTTLTSSHKSLLNYLKQMISIYDANNSGGLWSYLKYSRNYQGSRISIVALAIACFLSDRALICLQANLNEANSSDDVSKHVIVLRDEIAKLRKVCLIKLESARKSKHYLDYSHFIEALIESVNRSDKVQYSEGVQLIVTFVKTIYSASSPDDVACMNRILPTIDS